MGVAIPRRPRRARAAGPTSITTDTRASARKEASAHMSQSMLDAARLSLSTAENLEQRAERWCNRDDWQEYRDELSLAQAQALIAIAGALTTGPDEPDVEPQDETGCICEDPECDLWTGLNALEDEVDAPEPTEDASDPSEAPLDLTPELLARVVVARLWLGGDWV